MAPFNPFTIQLSEVKHWKSHNLNMWIHMECFRLGSVDKLSADLGIAPNVLNGLTAGVLEDIDDEQVFRIAEYRGMSVSEVKVWLELPS